MKKFICVILMCVCLASCIIPINAKTPTWTFNARTGTLYVWSDWENTPRYNKPEWEDQKANIRTVVFAYGVTTINEYAFWECTELRTVYFPATLKEIQYDAFRGCTKLNNVYLPYGVTTLGWNVFEDCMSLRHFYLPPTVTSIGDFAFAGCTGLYSISLSSKIQKLGNYVFHESNIHTILYSGTYKQWQQVDIGYHCESVLACRLICWPSWH